MALKCDFSVYCPGAKKPWVRYDWYHPLVEGWYKSYGTSVLDGGVIGDISEDDIGGDMLLGGVY